MTTQTDVANIVTRKVAGVPLIGWAAIAGVTVTVISRARARRATPAATDTTATTPTGYDTSLAPTGGTAAPSSTVTPQSGTGTVGTSYTYADNQDWRRAAFSALTARGYDPVAVDQALTAYLNSAALSQTQANMIGAALAALGPTPQPVVLIVSPEPATPPGSTNPPATNPPPGTPGEKRPPLTLSTPLPYPWNLIRQVYGNVNAGMVSRWAAANGLAFDGKQVTPWKAGMVVRFPAL